MIDLSIRSKAGVWIGTIAGTFGCIAVALIVDSFNFANLDSQALLRAIAVNIWLPTLLAGPLLYLLLSKIRELALARDEMAALATTDSLTAVLNRGAFHMLVEAYLAQANGAALQKRGSLLVIDADHFKAINDGLGHQRGDAALKLIVGGIKAALRQADLVGRIGGEEFGVFLPGATRAQALHVAERIRKAVNETPFPQALSVSIGGVSFQNQNDYDDLFRIADGCLYEAKNGGRNQVRVKDYGGEATA